MQLHAAAAAAAKARAARVAALEGVVGARAGGPGGRRKGEPGHAPARVNCLLMPPAKYGDASALGGLGC